MKRIFIIHGWGGRPDKGWLAWLNRELTKRGFKVYAERMPDPENPRINSWVSYLKDLVKIPDEETFFIGHSIGGQTIMRYIESLPKDAKIGGVIFVAGWLNLKNLETEDEKEVSTPWIQTPIDLNNIKNKIHKIVALFSDNDPWVPFEDRKLFQKNLGAKIIIQKNKGHYIEDVTKSIPVVLKQILNIIGQYP